VRVCAVLQAGTSQSEPFWDGRRDEIGGKAGVWAQALSKGGDLGPACSDVGDGRLGQDLVVQALTTTRISYLATGQSDWGSECTDQIGLWGI
jgi:hypothetical protein